MFPIHSLPLSFVVLADFRPSSPFVIEDHAQGDGVNSRYLTWSSSSATQKSQSALRPLGSSFPAIALNLSARLSAIATVSLSTNIRSPLSFGGLSPLVPYKHHYSKWDVTLQVNPSYTSDISPTHSPEHTFAQTPNTRSTNTRSHQTPVRPPNICSLGDPNTVLLLAVVSTLLARCSGRGLLIDWLVSFLTGGLPRRAYPRYLYTVLGDMHICGGACG